MGACDPLVYITKSASPLDFEKQIEIDQALRKARAERYILQSIAKEAIPKERVSICSRRRINKDVDIEVWKHLATQKAFYAGLMVCGSVWTCPVCAAKISERRRSELKQAIQIHRESKGRVAMLTLTFSHQRTDRLFDTLDRFLKALRRFRSGKAYTKVVEPLGLIGSIRSFEITYGQNGFHPHVHILMFYNNPVIMPLIEMQLFRLWENACAAFGLTTRDKYGLTIQDGGQADDYVTKWGIDQEMTKSHVKKGREDGLTPFDFLRKYMETEEHFYLHLFAEYATALKGKSQLFWSRGLKDKFLIEEKSDEDLATEKTEMADLLGTLKYYQWLSIMHSEKRARFLELCEENEFERALELIKIPENIKEIAPSKPGTQPEDKA